MNSGKVLVNIPIILVHKQLIAMDTKSSNKHICGQHPVIVHPLAEEEIENYTIKETFRKVGTFNL